MGTTVALYHNEDIVHPGYETRKWGWPHISLNKNLGELTGGRVNQMLIQGTRCRILLPITIIDIYITGMTC
eukprot:scaffold10218_cov39-Attheya_sp.AAC.1